MTTTTATTDIDTEAPARQRAYASGARLSVPLGITEATLIVDLVPQGRPNRKDDTRFPFVCADSDHEDPVKVTQRYICPDGHGPFQEHELARARPDADGVLRVASKEEIAEAKTGGLEKLVASFLVHPADQVAAVCRPGELGYRLRLPKKHTSSEARAYAEILQLVQTRPDLAMVAPIRIRDTRLLVRLTAFGGQLLIEEMVHPSDLAAVDVQDLPEVNAAKMEKVAELLELEALPFDPEVYRHDAAAAIASLVAARAADPASDQSAPAAVDDAQVIDLLEATLAKRRAEKAGGAAKRIARPRKAAAKKAPAKKAAAKTTPRKRAATAAS